ncbi:hypothetical protein INS49_003481 [Diaporthe citri]|uniref:uncharacterized protein n=1 Tax=Diaporthe citri TaxID=83186 RepID=UPI001C819E18|nr:uncharacterized protein INS49_003481 [Diaporthe citri]KAG6355519.1 hypothetical protein INS49_003481 [Diaporthe citri]
MKQAVLREQLVQFGLFDYLLNKLDSEPGSTSASYRSRAATIVYVDFCFDVLDQSPPIQALYLDVLSEFLRLSSDGLLRNAVDEFCTVLGNKDKEELHWNLAFLAKVNHTLLFGLGARGPIMRESLKSLYEMGKQVFPLSLFTPLNAAKEPRRRKRKQESGSGRKRKNQRTA